MTEKLSLPPVYRLKKVPELLMTERGVVFKEGTYFDSVIMRALDALIDEVEISVLIDHFSKDEETILWKLNVEEARELIFSDYVNKYFGLNRFVGREKLMEEYARRSYIAGKIIRRVRAWKVSEVVNPPVTELEKTHSQDEEVSLPVPEPVFSAQLELAEMAGK